MADFTINSLVICDDVRREVTGKDILIGAFGGGMLVPEFPTAIPVALWIELTPEKAGPLQIDLKIAAPGNASAFEISLTGDFATTDESTSIHTPQIMLPILKAGLIQVFARGRRDEEWVVIKAKRIAQGPAATLTPPKDMREDIPSLPDPVASAPRAKPRASRRPATRRVA